MYWKREHVLSGPAGIASAPVNGPCRCTRGRLPRRISRWRLRGGAWAAGRPAGPSVHAAGCAGRPCARCWGSPRAAPRPPQLLQPDSRAGRWTQQKAWGGARKCGGWGWGEDTPRGPWSEWAGRPLWGTQCTGLVECWARSPAAGSQLSSL